MSKSLQDQLKALGLAKEPVPKPVAKNIQKPNSGSPQPARRLKENPLQAQLKQTKAKQAKPQDNALKPSRQPGPPTVDGGNLTLEQAYVLLEQQLRAEAEASKESKRLEDLKRRQINNAIKAIVEPHRLNDPAAEVARHFTYKGRIRKVSVTLEQFKALNDGKLGLVYLSGGYHVLETEHINQVRTLSEDHVPDLSGGAEEEEQFPVPDDLIW